MVSETTGPLQTSDPLSWPSPPPHKGCCVIPASLPKLRRLASTPPLSPSLSRARVICDRYSKAASTTVESMPTGDGRVETIQRALAVSPSNLSNNRHLRTPNPTPGLDRGRDNRGGQGIAHRSRRRTHGHAQNTEPTSLSSGVPGWPAAQSRARWQQRSHPILSFSNWRRPWLSPLGISGTASGLLPSRCPFSHRPSRGSYSQIRSSENTHHLGFISDWALQVQARFVPG